MVQHPWGNDTNCLHGKAKIRKLFCVFLPVAYSHSAAGNTERSQHHLTSQILKDLSLRTSAQPPHLGQLNQVAVGFLITAHTAFQRLHTALLRIDTL